MATSFVDLSHKIVDGMETYPGLPVPIIADHLSREAAEEVYGEGITFQIGLVTMCTNTGTYIDVPFHRFPAGHDLTGLALDRVAEVPGVRVDCRGQQQIVLDDVDVSKFADMAVLIWTGHDALWGSSDYFVSHPALTEQAAQKLRDANVACVGIDSLNIDETDRVGRPVHRTLLGADIPIVEHLTNLDELGDDGFTFSAVPPKIEGAGTFTVRAYARTS